MQIDANAPRKGFKFKGHTVQVPQPFTEGQPLTANLTRFVNRQLASVTGNALASAINRRVDNLNEEDAKRPEGERRAKPFTAADISADDVQKMFDAIFTAYEPGAESQSGGAVSRDPVQAIADNIAWERIKPLLVAAGISVGKVKADKKAELIAQVHAKDPSIMEVAKATLATTAPTEGLDSLIAGMATAPAADTNSGSANGDDTMQGDSGNDTLPGDDGQNTTDTPDPNAPAGAPTGRPEDGDTNASSVQEVDGQTADGGDTGLASANAGEVARSDDGTGQGAPTGEDLTEGSDSQPGGDDHDANTPTGGAFS